MGENTHIEWAEHTLNPWWGCSKVHEGCTNCYAEGMDRRLYPAGPLTRCEASHWGPKAPRLWRDPERRAADLRKWNRAAEKKGVRARVFCGSMCDFFEESKVTVREDGSDSGHTTAFLRHCVFRMVHECPWLIFLFLTKRPENIAGMIPAEWHDSMPENVMFGTSVSSERSAGGIKALVKAPGRKFLSCEPLLGHIDLMPGIESGAIDWVIAGGESGPHARGMDDKWVRSLRNQCVAMGVPFFFKQWGGLRPGGEALLDGVAYKAFPDWHSVQPQLHLATEVITPGRDLAAEDTER